MTATDAANRPARSDDDKTAGEAADVSDDTTKPPNIETTRPGLRVKGPGTAALPVSTGPEGASDDVKGDDADTRHDWQTPTPATAPESGALEPPVRDAEQASPNIGAPQTTRAAHEPRVRVTGKANLSGSGAQASARAKIVSKPPPSGRAGDRTRHAPGPTDPMPDPSGLQMSDDPARSGRQTTQSDDAAHLAQSLRAAQRLYHESRRRFHDFVLSASDWVWETDEFGAISFVSDRITDLVGKPSRTLIGAYMVELGNDVVIGRSLRDALAARRPFRGLAIEIVGADGKHRFCRISGIPAFNQDNGRFIGFRGAGSDCTAQFEAEEMARRSQAKLERLIEEVRTKNDRLEDALADAKAAIRAKSEFLANVSHELRTPLNAIIGFTEIMDGEMYGPLGHERYSEYTGSVLQSGRHLLSIINDLLEMAKVDAGRLELKERTLNAADVAEMSLSLMRDRIKQQNLDLTVRFPTNGPLLWGDERLIKQMLINLLANAVKFTPEGGALTVEGKVSKDGGYELSVADTGIGISAEHLEAVLEPFGQVESAMSRSHDGTGLGLPLVNAMIQLHGGTLELESAPNAGTTATLRFPPERVLDPPANT